MTERSLGFKSAFNLITRMVAKCELPALGHQRTFARSCWIVRLGKKGTSRETVLYNPSTMNARDFVDLIRMAVISFVF